MTHYITNEGEHIEARDARTLVRKLRESAHHHSNTDREFMVEVAERCKMQNADWIIPTDTVERFVDGLVTYGLVKPAGG